MNTPILTAIKKIEHQGDGSAYVSLTPEMEAQLNELGVTSDTEFAADLTAPGQITFRPILKQKQEEGA